jgi:uncharacterized membrane protein
MQLWQLLGNLHPKLVQFPLVLLLVGLIFDAIGLGRRSRSAHWAGMACTALGTLGLLFAFICGIYAEIWAGRAGIPHHPIELHELVANLASWGFVILLAWRIFLVPPPQGAPGLFKTYLVTGFAWYGLLALTGYLGGQLVFEYGAAVAGAQAPAVLSLSDLNTLATRQTDENLRYSEWMHHIFGWMTLGLAMSLLAQAAWPARAKKFRPIVPAFLLLGGLFLFFMADRDLYAFTDLRQWRDREVQLHKALAVIMATIGVIGLVRIFKGPAAETATATGPAAEAPRPKVENSKLVAVLALIGGSMLFTHVHTVAPYANVAAGVYIAHVVMGLVALAIGAARLAQDFFPPYRRQLAIAFAGFMAIESALLITYNEGLPWYIGYGRYNRWGPLGEADPGVTVAPFGKFRALMDINNADGIAYVAFRDRFTDDAAELTFDRPPQLIVSRGYQEIAIPMTKSPAEGELANQPDTRGELTGTNFRGFADFLKTTPWMSARLVLSINGKEHVGYFDPWVTRAVKAVPPNEVARFECPMHEGMRSSTEGKCNLCKMDMQPIRAPRPAEVLHDPGFDLAVEVDPTRPGDGAHGLLIRPTKGGETIQELAIVHEQPVHLMVVSTDLAYFDHIHPTARGGGVYALRYKFPRPGEYLLFADITPKGDRAQFFRIPLRVTNDVVEVLKDAVPANNKLVPEVAGTKLAAVVPAGRTPQESAALDLTKKVPPEAERVQAQLLTQPRTMAAGIHGDLLFRLSDRAGRPVTDLLPYLGAMGHCVVISEDTTLYLHSHPATVFWPADGRGGPEVAFHTLFPKAGRYRVWAQFKRPAAGDAPVNGGLVGPAAPGVPPPPPERLVIAEFVVEVKEPVVPAGVINFLLGD